jgi:hypothetical protein
MDGAARSLTIGQESSIGVKARRSHPDATARLRPETAFGEKTGERDDNGQDGRQMELRPHGTVLSIE